MESRVSQITVNQHHRSTDLGNGNAKIADHGRLAVAWARAREYQNARMMSVLARPKNRSECRPDAFSHERSLALPCGQFRRTRLRGIRAVCRKKSQLKTPAKTVGDLSGRSSLSHRNGP